MFDLIKLDEFFEKADECIKIYATKFAVQKNYFDSLTGNYAYIVNERTVAAFSNYAFLKLLQSYGYDILLCSNEFPIRINNAPSFKEFDEMKEDVGETTKVNCWHNCYVDGYFLIKDFVSPNSYSHVFVEYKMNNSFVFLDLADDYLKYKVYTSRNEANTIFAYLIFDKKECYPTILNTKKPRYKIIGSKIDKASISSDTKIFIYLGKDKIDKREDIIRKPLKDASDKISDITKITSNLNNILEIERASISDDKKIFVENMRYYNSKVLKSNTLKNYFYFIKNVWDRSNKTNIFSNLKEIFGIAENEELTIEKIIKEGATYKTNLSEIISTKDKVDAYKKGVRGSTNTSLFIVAAIDYFNEYFNIGVDSPIYSIKYFRSGKEKIPVNLNDTVKYFKDELRKKWSRNSFLENNAKKFAYSIMFYIVNLFSIIYKISDDNKKLEFSNEYRSYKIIDYLQDEMRKVLKWFGISKKFYIDVNDLIDNRNEAIKNLTDFVNFIIDSY